MSNYTFGNATLSLNFKKRFKEFGIDVYKLDGQNQYKREKYIIKSGLEDGSIKTGNWNTLCLM